MRTRHGRKDNFNAKHTFHKSFIVIYSNFSHNAFYYYLYPNRNISTGINSTINIIMVHRCCKSMVVVDDDEVAAVRNLVVVLLVSMKLKFMLRSGI